MQEALQNNTGTNDNTVDKPESERQKALQVDAINGSEGNEAAEIEQVSPLQALADKRQRPVLCIVGNMDEDSLYEVRRLAPQLKESDTLSVLLDSPGGYIEHAYRIVLALREYVQDIEVLVPRWAKSAATFFCLAANTIHMGRYGELGPLDPQRLNLRGSAIPVSALESFQALSQLLKYSLDSLDAIVQRLLMNAPMDIPYAIEHAQPLFAAVLSPLYSQVDPHELGEAGRSLAISEEYAVRVMERWGYAEIMADTRWQIARRLTWDYPTHGFVIDLTEAQQVGLNAHRLDDESDELCQNLLVICQTIIKQSKPKISHFVHIEFPNTPDNQTYGGENDVEPKGEETAERNPAGQQNSS